MDRVALSFLFLFSLIVILPAVDAQEFSFGERANQRSVEVKISEDGKMFVTHEIDSSNRPQELELMDGTISNLSVTDENGGERQVTTIGDNDSVLILPSQTNTIVNYELGNVLEFKNHYWTLDFLYLESTKFFLPEDLVSVYVNDQKVELKDGKGFVCHGCDMIVKYSFDEPRIIQDVKWEEHEFDVEVISFSGISNFVFDQPGKSLTFDISEEGEYLTILIPLELLWEPYTVFLDDNKIKVAPIGNNGTHVSLFMKPGTSGEINIVGTTVVPEFPIIAPLVIGFLMLLVLPFAKKKLNPR